MFKVKMFCFMNNKYTLVRINKMPAAKSNSEIMKLKFAKKTLTIKR